MAHAVSSSVNANGPPAGRAVLLMSSPCVTSDGAFRPLEVRRTTVYNTRLGVNVEALHKRSRAQELAMRTQPKKVLKEVDDSVSARL
jgi:hypothetical protein